MLKLTLGKQIQIARIARDLPQRQVARETSIPAGVLSEIENDWRVPSTEQREKICSAIGITPADLDDEA